MRPLLIGFGLIAGLLLVTLAFPRSWVARLLLSEHGPSLAVPRMTRGDCLPSAGGYLLISVIAAGSIAAIDYLGSADNRSAWDHQPLAALMFTYAILMAVGVMAAIYLLICAVFRPWRLSANEKPESLDTGRVDV